MLKCHELADLTSCLHRAHDGEMVFVLLARDPVAPNMIRFWVEERIRLGKNQLGDKQIQEAINCARVMEEQRLADKKFSGHHE